MASMVPGSFLISSAGLRLGTLEGVEGKVSNPAVDQTGADVESVSVKLSCLAWMLSTSF